MKHIILFMLLLLSASCSSFSSSRAQPTSISSTTLPATNLTTSPTPLPKLTLTIEIATPSPFVTLPPAEAEAMILELHQNNGGCRLPCWWGLTPGKTSAQTAISLFERLTEISLRTAFFDDVGGAHWRIDKNDLLLDTIVSFTHNRLLSDNIESFRITIDVKRELQGGGFETVWENPLNEQFLQAYRLPQILSIYGQPEEVLIFANEGWRYLELMLDYSDQGFAIWYSVPLESSGERFLGCPSKAFTKLYLWAPEFAYTWAEGVTGTGDKSEIDSLNRDFQPLEETTSMTLDEFYDVFVNADTASCLETPKELWPGP
jgi:hypothetical protein